MKKNSMLVILLTLVLVMFCGIANAWMLPKDGNGVAVQNVNMYGGVYTVISTTTSATTIQTAGNVVVLLDVFAVTTATATAGSIVITDAAGSTASTITLVLQPSKDLTRSVMIGAAPLRLTNGMKIRPMGAGVKAVPVYIKE